MGKGLVGDITIIVESITKISDSISFIIGIMTGRPTQIVIADFVVYFEVK